MKPVSPFVSRRTMANTAAGSPRCHTVTRRRFHVPPGSHERRMGRASQPLAVNPEQPGLREAASPHGRDSNPYGPTAAASERTASA